MKIYIAHSRSFDFHAELYRPLRESDLNNEHSIILPHEHSDEAFPSQKYLQEEADLLIAEVSEASTGLGIELGWANIYQVPIICIYKTGSAISGSLNTVSSHFVEYTDSEELISGIEHIIKQLQK